MVVYRLGVKNLMYTNSNEDLLRLFVHFVLKVDNNFYNVHCIAICK